jgi:phosphonate transport system substrate-binding protein
LLAACAAASALALGGCDRFGRADHVRYAPDELAFAIPSPAKGAEGKAAKGQDARDQDAEARWRPLLADMQAQTGLTVHPVFASSGRDAVDALESGRAQAGLFTDAAGLEAVRRADGEVFAAAGSAAAPDGRASVVVVRARSPLTLDQVLRCGRRLSYGGGEARSVAGTLAPSAYLFAPHGLSPSTCFRAVRAGDLGGNLVSVASGGLDAAASDTPSLKALAARRPQAARELKVIWTSPTLPAEPMVWRKDLDPSVKEKLRAFLMGYGQAPGAEGERQRQVLAGVGLDRFRPAGDALLLPLREMDAAEALMKARDARDAAGVRRAETELARIRRAQAAAAKAG